MQMLWKLLIKYASGTEHITIQIHFNITLNLSLLLPIFCSSINELFKRIVKTLFCTSLTRLSQIYTFAFN
jgi:hypothetical protein